MRQEISRVKENIEWLKREDPKFDPELLRQQQVAQLIKPFKRLRRMYLEVEPKILAYYLSKPPDEQPLWLNSGMSDEERKNVINDYLKLAINAKMAPPLKAPGNHTDRAIKRQTMLTFKQWQVARFTVDGLDIKEIAARLKIGERMVKTQLQAIRRKANLDRNAKIVLWFLGY
jgi:DNA-binding CsgD family transcriptional regulator